MGTGASCSCRQDNATTDFYKDGTTTGIAAQTNQPLVTESAVSAVDNEEKNLKKEYAEVLEEENNEGMIYAKILSPVERKLQDVLKTLGPHEEFIDKDFPHAVESIAQITENKEKVKDYLWQKAKTTMSDKEDLTLFDEKRSQRSFKVGNLNNPFFSTALCGLSTKSELISRLFSIKKINENGIYAVWINHDGQWKEVIVDDYVPCEEGQNLAYIQPQENELWSLLLEKAYAKVYKCYERLEIGSAAQVIQDLSGSPYKSVDTMNQDAVWNFISQNCNQHIMIASLQYFDSPQKVNVAGITGGNTKTTTPSATNNQYAVIINAKEISSSPLGQQQYQTERVLKLRNPFGAAQWKGEWRDTSSKWSNELKVELNYDENEECDYYVTMQEFCSQFKNVSCNFLNADYFYSSKTFNNENSEIIVTPLYLKENNTHIYFQFHQQDKRNYSPTEYYSYSLVNFFIFRGSEVDDGYKVVQYEGEDQSYQRNSYIERKLDNAGLYLVLTKVKWASNSILSNSSNINRSITLSTYSSKPVEIKTEVLESAKRQKLIDDCLTNITPIMSKDIHEYQEDKHITRFVNNSLGYFYFVYKNISSAIKLKEIVQLKNRKGLQICEPYSDSDKFTVELEKDQSKIIKYQILPDAMDFFQPPEISYSTQFTFEYSEMINQTKQFCTKPSYRDQNSKVQFYDYPFKGGLSLFFINNSDKVYQEDITIDLTNLESTTPSSSSSSPSQCALAGDVKSGLPFTFKIEPKKTYLIVFKQVDILSPIDYKISYKASLI